MSHRFGVNPFNELNKHQALFGIDTRKPFLRVALYGSNKKNRSSRFPLSCYFLNEYWGYCLA